MSRWAERFAALSGTHDTIDTSDTRSGDENARPCVANCQSVQDKRSAVPSVPKPAEILDSTNGDRPSVTSVASVMAQPSAGVWPAGTEPTPSPTLLTEADTSSSDYIEERAAIIEEATDYSRRWAEGYATLCTMPPPPSFSARALAPDYRLSRDFPRQLGRRSDPLRLVRSRCVWLSF